MELRTLADWVVRQRLLTIPGVSQVFVDGRRPQAVPGAGRSRRSAAYGVTLDEVETALAESNENATGGYLDQQGPQGILVRVAGPDCGRSRT